MKIFQLLILSIILSSCGKNLITNSSREIFQNHITESECMTDKQFKQYLKFKIDSIAKIEKANTINNKKRNDFIQDSLKIELKREHQNNSFEILKNRLKIKQLGKTIDSLKIIEKEITKRNNSNNKKEIKIDNNEVKENISKNKQDSKTKRTEIKQENKKSLWWLFIIIGFFIRILFQNIIRYFLPLVTNIKFLKGIFK